MSVTILIALLLLPGPNLYLPIKAADRNSISSLRLTDIGQFGLQRKERLGVPAHLHTGIDIRRPGTNYENEPIFAVANGTVISVRYDGAFAQAIVAHESDGLKFWTVYEHIAEVRVKPGDDVKPQEPFARFMNMNELDKYGHQFDHFHFEVLKVAPVRLAADAKHPARLFSSYTLSCKNDGDLTKYFHDPIGFLKKGM